MNQSQDKGTQGTEGQGTQQPNPQPSQDGGQSQKQTGQSQGQGGSSGSQVKSAQYDLLADRPFV